MTLDTSGSLASDRREIREREREMREEGFSAADVREETLRAERSLLAVQCPRCGGHPWGGYCGCG